jgi:hypothetical protein
MMQRRRPLLQEYPTKKIPNLKNMFAIFGRRRVDC